VEGRVIVCAACAEGEEVLDSPRDCFAEQFDFEVALRGV
jgi:hypothetical protein